MNVNLHISNILAISKRAVGKSTLFLVGIFLSFKEQKISYYKKIYFGSKLKLNNLMPYYPIFCPKKIILSKIKTSNKLLIN